MTRFVITILSQSTDIVAENSFPITFVFLLEELYQISGSKISQPYSTITVHYDSNICSKGTCTSIIEQDLCDRTIGVTIFVVEL